MQLVKDGPEIPVEILDEQERSNLAIFCGAGVSAPEGLPLFSGLLKLLKKDLNIDKYPQHIESEHEKGNFDRVLTHLDKEFDRKQVIKHVKRHLATPTTLTTTIHQNLITLATSRNNYLRLVTTNFDHLFEKANTGINYHEAPALPVPKPYKWNSLVYLHGRLEKDDDNGNHLVLNTGDFGLAYLFEGWAAKFITEIFRHFTILFVGYSANDPIMRYIVDALAIEREKGLMLKQAYAFSHFSSKKSKKETNEEWKSKNIVPILYDDKGNHALLNQTIEKWSELWGKGWEAKQNLITQLGTNDPNKLHERQINQFLFALKDPTGKASEKLVEHGHQIPVSWMPYMDKSKYWTNDNKIQNSDEIQNGESLFSKEFYNGKVSSNTREIIYRNIAKWLVSDLSKEELIIWAIEKKLQIGNFTVELLKRELIKQIENKSIGDGKYDIDQVINFWSLVLIANGVDRYRDDFWIQSLLDNDVWNAQIKEALMGLLSVVPVVNNVRWG